MRKKYLGPDNQVHNNQIEPENIIACSKMILSMPMGNYENCCYNSIPKLQLFSLPEEITKDIYFCSLRVEQHIFSLGF